MSQDNLLRFRCQKCKTANYYTSKNKKKVERKIEPTQRLRASGVDLDELLRLAAATATTLWLPRSAWSQARFSSNPFALGVASGSPTHDSLVLWTRLVQTGLFGTSTLGAAPVTVLASVGTAATSTAQTGDGASAEGPHASKAVVVEPLTCRWPWRSQRLRSHLMLRKREKSGLRQTSIESCQSSLPSS